MSSLRSAPAKFAGDLCEPAYGLRDYQRQVVGDALAVLGRRKDARVVLHLPTGAGKTRVAASLIGRLMLADPKPEGIFVWLASADELCDQAATAISSAWRALGDRSLYVSRFVGSTRGKLHEVPTGFLVCSLPKLWSVINSGRGDLAAFAPRVSGVVFDEAHQAVAATYRRVTDQLSNWAIPVIGLTATPGRHALERDGSEHLAEFFGRNKVTIKASGSSDPIDYLTRRKYLARPVMRPIPRDGVAPSPPTSSGDYPSAYHETLGGCPPWIDAVREAIDDALKHCCRIIVFAPTVATAVSLAEEYASKVRSSDAVVSGTGSKDRTEAVERFCEPPSAPDDRRLIFNYAVFTAGFDAPATDAVVIGQPTRSLVRYSQMVGRALRGPRSGGSEECYIYTITDSHLPGFSSAIDAFNHWEELWQ